MTRPKCACLDPKAKRRSFGSLRILPSGRHQARYQAPDGKLHTAPITFDTHGDAEMYLSTVRTDIARGLWAPPSAPAATTLTLGTYAEAFMAVRDLKPRTRDGYRRVLDKFILPTFEDASLAEITPSDVVAWHAGLDTGKVYRAHAYGLLRTITRSAVAEKLITSSPCTIPKAGQVKRRHQPKPLSMAQLEKLVAATPAPYRLMVLLGAWCALRYGELVELRRRDVDTRNGIVHVHRGVTFVKGQAIVGKPKSDAGERDVHVPPHLLPLIKGHLRQHAGIELLFPGPNGDHLRPATFYESIWHPARKAAGLPKMHFHDTRHTGAVLAAQSGATLAELMGRLGHSTPAAAMIYQHVAAGRDKIIAAKLSELANGSTS